MATDQYRAPEHAPKRALIPKLYFSVIELCISRKPKKAALPNPHLKAVIVIPLFKFIIDLVKCEVLVCD